MPREPQPVPEVNSTSTQAAASPAPRYRRWLRFSLLNFLLASALICVCVSHFAISRRVARLEVEREKLRSEVGLLTIVDPTQLNVVQVPVRQELAWRWRVHVPEGAKYRLCSACGSIPSEGFITPHTTSTLQKPGEAVIDAYLHKDLDGKLLFTLRGPNASATSSVPDDSSWVSGNTSSISMSDVDKTTKAFLPNSPVVLLRHRIQKKPATGVGPTVTNWDSEPTDGLLIWLEPSAP